MAENQSTVLHVIPALNIGGAEQALVSLVTAKRAQPFSQIVVTLLSGGALTDTIRNAGIKVLESSADSPITFPFSVLGMSRLIRKYRPVAIQSWLYYADLAAYWALKLSGRRAATRLYWGVRSSDMDARRYRPELAWAIKACARRAAAPDAVIANSYAGREYHRRLGYAPRAFPVIPNGIDTERFKPNPAARALSRSQLGVPDDTPLVMHVARVDPMKDHASLIAVASALPEVQFVMAGTGTETLRGPPNLRALGEQRFLSALYPAADLAISTSAFGEGFPNVVAEAMACGLPVVATDVGDSRRIVGDTGAIVSPRDVPAMINAVREFLHEPRTQRESRGQAARTRIAEHYSLGRTVAAFDALHLHGTLPPDDRP
jgi:glycosyltransferase involved in cell wall biosynthesis